MMYAIVVRWLWRGSPSMEVRVYHEPAQAGWELANTTSSVQQLPLSFSIFTLTPSRRKLKDLKMFCVLSSLIVTNRRKAESQWERASKICSLLCELKTVQQEKPERPRTVMLRKRKWYFILAKVINLTKEPLTAKCQAGEFLYTDN